MFNGVQIIAEVKTRSPFGFQAEKSWEELFAIATRVGDMVSIHTDPRWGGSMDLVAKAKRLTDKPILAKGIHATDELVREAFEAGADRVLVVGRVPSVHPERCLVEPNTLDELRALPSTLSAVWNARDLATGHPKSVTFGQARAAWEGWLCQASFITTIHDIAPGAQAVLVGEHLETFAKSMET